MPDSPSFGLAARPRRSRLPSFVLSLGIHAVAASLLIAMHAPSLPEPEDPGQLARRERKIIWYTPTTRLPAVAPAEPVRGQSGRAAEFRAMQHIAATAANPESRRQMVLQ